MAITRNIRATYTGPGRVVSGLLAAGQREDRALAYLMAGCLVVFVAQLPRLAREAHMTGGDLNMMMGGALMGWVLIAPLALYVIAGMTFLIGKLFRGQGTAFGARLALFWALLASSPLMLLNGLVAGFIGPGLELQVVGFLWFAFFLWFWLAGFMATQKADTT